MIYLEKNTEVQDLYIPRQNTINVEETGIDLSEYLTSGQTIELIDETVDAAIEELDLDEFVTSGDVQTQIDESISGIPTEFKTINNESIIGEGNIDIEGGSYTAGANIDITNDVISVTGITIPDVSQFVTSGDVQTQIDESISGIPTEFKTINNESIIGSGNIEIDGETYTAGTNIDISNENVISVTGITIPDVSQFVTSGDVQTQIESYNYQTSGDVQTQIESYNYQTSGDVQTQIESYNYQTSGDVQDAITAATSGMATEQWVESQGYLTEHQSLSAYSTTVQVEGMIASAKTEVENEIPDVSNFVTSADVQTQITAITSTKQDILVSGTNIKTINNESILGSGNLEIQGGGDVVELTKAQYEALGTGWTEDTTYIITDADTVDLNDYALESAVTSAITEINTSLATKATKASVSANTNRQFPIWNAEGIITGTTGNTCYEQNLNINGTTKTMIQTTNSSFGTIYAPTTTGTKNQILLSNGSGAPVWSTYKFQFISQSDYDAITTKDSTTIYFIISED